MQDPFRCQNTRSGSWTCTRHLTEITGAVHEAYTRDVPLPQSCADTRERQTGTKQTTTSPVARARSLRVYLQGTSKERKVILAHKHQHRSQNRLLGPPVLIGPCRTQSLLLTARSATITWGQCAAHLRLDGRSDPKPPGKSMRTRQSFRDRSSGSDIPDSDRAL